MIVRKLLVFCAVVALLAGSVSAQIGKSQGVADVNTVAEAELAKMPHMTPAIAKALVAKRPFMSATELNAFLLSQGLTAEQAMEFYGKAFVHINLNTATSEEIMLVPGAGKRMAREFAEYRPYVPGVPGHWMNVNEGNRSLQVHLFGAEGVSPLGRSATRYRRKTRSTPGWRWITKDR